MTNKDMPRGIYPMLYAFFTQQGGLDRAAVRRQVRAFVAHGAHGMAALGLGTEVNKLSDAERTRMRKRKIGFVFQKFNLLPTLDALGNIEIAREIAGTDSNRDERYFKKIVDLLGLEKRLPHRPSELSGGEQQRVALARALINKPAIVLADEPTGNLDSKNSDIVLNMLRHSNCELGQTVLMITHNPEAASYGDRIIHMRDGKIAA